MLEKNADYTQEQDVPTLKLEVERISWFNGVIWDWIDILMYTVCNVLIILIAHKIQYFNSTYEIMNTMIDV